MGISEGENSKPKGLHDPDFTQAILNRGGYDDIEMCFLCEHRDKETCPYRGNERAGACALFSLSKGTAEAEQEIIRFLQKQPEQPKQ